MRSNARVLVVDDEAIVRDVLSRYLTRDGFSVDYHALDEQFDSTASWKGTVRAFLLTILLAGA